ncbi:2-amino-4-hydroxy-6-hydroxymethyldihydropteridine diphosphokinase [Parahaliea aestuarii]|uniref:2-amino-4-hydroxy-6-hydroxymethyldihydropteridine diphosphokinase n=1 Tax=Parahaliea aestuarii TaxID=1852021 RepID=A0A5C8ZPW4_9GAMM|nr:2-amino-4-hydroxy-6-hydroxymethyldihydropteridine diphosphokinase [Parahaliea aestuarii]TXS89391.1 2-amino-4-hydroxy-6-hydroxymethyldihydropteridine diphosphokinase [Parahaliea aestuarii]
MPRVYLGLGSNIERERYLAAGLDALEALYGHLDLSPVYDCEAIGFSGQPFLNMVVGIDTEASVAELARDLRRIETEHGRLPDATRYSPRQLDIDLLTYGDSAGEVDGVQLPRAEILTNAFVLRPLSELAPEDRHPVDGRSYAALWDAFDRESQQVRRVAFTWRGREISGE